MKKYKWYVAFAAVIISVLTLYLINYIVINKTYATPEESFLNTLATQYIKPIKGGHQ